MTKHLIRSAQVDDFASIQSIYAIEVREHTATFETTPPDMEVILQAGGVADVGKKRFTLQGGLDHAISSSLRTSATPSTMFCNFCLAAQRAG